MLTGIERRCMALLEGCTSRPRRCVVSLVLITLVLSCAGFFLEIDTDGASLYPQSHPVVQATREDRVLFRDQDEVFVLLRARSPEVDFTTPSGLRFLKATHEALAQLPGVETQRVRSVASVLDPEPGMNLLSIPHALDQVPEDETKARILAGRMLESPLVRGLYLSADASVALVSLELGQEKRADGLARINAWVNEQPQDTHEILLTGPVTAEVLLGQRVLSDMLRIIPILIGVLCVLLFATLRSLGGVLVCMIGVLVILLWMAGLMACLRFPITLVSVILPVVLLTSTITDEIHLLNRFRVRLASGATTRDAIRAATADVARPILLTSMTTGIAFLSFSSSSLAPVREFGICVAVGISLAMVFTFTLNPALTLLLPGSLFRPEAANRGSQRLPRFETWVLHRQRLAPLLAALLVLAAVPGLTRLQIQDSWIRNFRTSDPIVRADRILNKDLSGSYRLDVVLSSEQPAYFQSAPGLHLLESLSAIEVPHVDKQLNALLAYQVLSKVEGTSNVISSLDPQTIQRYSRNLQRIEGRIDLDRYLVGTGKHARVRFLVRDADFDRTREVLAALESQVGTILEGTGVSFHISGELAGAQAAVESVVHNMLRSVGWTLLGILLLLSISLRGFRLAAACLVPLIAGVLLVLGAMGMSGQDLGISNSMFLAVTVGVGIDFAIHLLHGYSRINSGSALPEDATRRALSFAGYGIRWSALVLTFGLAVLVFSGARPIRSLGILLSMSIAACYVMSLLCLPWLLSFRMHRRALDRIVETSDTTETMHP